MADTRGVSERLKAGAAAEIECAELKVRMQELWPFFDENLISRASAGAKEYRKIMTSKTPKDIGYAGDPLPYCTAIDEVIHILQHKTQYLGGDL